ncbi:MAG: hypothetical protein AAFN74_18220, partial [Myxococcota bacterium]
AAFGHMMAPGAMMPMMAPYAAAGYAGGFQHMDLAAGSTNIPVVSWLLSGRRRAAGRMEHMLRKNPHMRAAFEAQMGGRIVNFGIRNDGKFTIQRFGPGFGMGAAINPMMAPAMGYMSGMGSFVNASAMSMGLPMGMPMFGANSMFRTPFMGMTAMGLYNAAGLRSPSNVAGGMYGFHDNSGVWGGRGFGSVNPQTMPGRINNTNPAYEMYHQHEADVLLADPSLTVEDKVTLLLMLIMKKMDRDIENQAQYINSIQQQQSNRGGKGKIGNPMNTGPFGQLSGSDNQSPSIDVETMKLKRLIDKRSQMFDMLRQIIDKYNETAKNMIQSMSR